jgi:hypothetical protein
MRISLAPALLAALAVPCVLAAPEVVVYRCVAADGAVTIQNDRRCPKGTQQQRRVVETPTSRAPPAAPATPAPVAAPAPIAPMSDAPGTATSADAARTGANARTAAPTTRTGRDATPTIEIGRAGAPPVFACRTWDGTRYYGDSEQPAPRCAPLQAVGLDGRSATAAQACELRADSCEPVLASARCEAWAERLRAAEAAIEFPTGDIEAARAELDRVRTTIAGTVCAR